MGSCSLRITEKGYKGACLRMEYGKRDFLWWLVSFERGKGISNAMNVISPASVGLHRWKILQSKGKNRQCAEQQVEGREGQGIEIRFAEKF